MVALNQRQPQVNYDLFYEVATRQFQDQMSRIDTANVRIGVFLSVATVLLGLSAALAVRTNANQPLYAIIPWGLAVASYIALSVFSILSYRARTWRGGPDLTTLEQRCASRDENENKQWLGEEYNNAFYYNEIQLTSKVKQGNWALWLLPAEATFLALALLLPALLN